MRRKRNLYILCKRCASFCKEAGVRINVKNFIYNMGDQYFVNGQAGAVGKNASAHSTTNYQQQWKLAERNIQLEVLAAELNALCQKLSTVATLPGHYVSISHIAAAEIAAKEANGSKALECLSKAGQWAWDVATKVGTGVMTELAKKAIFDSTT